MLSQESLPHASPATPARSEIEVSDTSVLLALVGPSDTTIRAISKTLGIEIGQRGSVLMLAGPAEKIAFAERFLVEITSTLATGRQLGHHDILRSLTLLQRNPHASLRTMFADVVVTPNHRTIAPKSENQKCYVDAIRSHDLTFGIGPAGTGKTYLAMAMAVQSLAQRRVKRIILTRPAVEAGEKLGFLPGDLAEKVNPYLRPLYDALHDMMDVEKVQDLLHREQIEVAPLAFMRGRTLNDCFVILDEAQNATSDQMRMFLTRLGFSSKAVVTGDITQIDLPSSQQSGLAEAHAVLQHISDIAFCYFDDVDIVRHPIVQKIVLAYEARDKNALSTTALGAT